MFGRPLSKSLGLNRWFESQRFSFPATAPVHEYTNIYIYNIFKVAPSLQGKQGELEDVMLTASLRARSDEFPPAGLWPGKWCVGSRNERVQTQGVEVLS